MTLTQPKCYEFREFCECRYKSYKKGNIFNDIVIDVKITENPTYFFRQLCGKATLEECKWT